MKRPKNIKLLRFIKKLQLFLIFLVISIIVWFFSTMSSEFTYWTDVMVSYSNDIKTVTLQDIPVENIKVKVKTNGFRLLYMSLVPPKIQFNYSDFKKLNGFSYYYLPNSHIRKLQRDWKGPEIVSFEKDTLWLSLGTLNEKKIKVIPNVEIDTKQGYLIKDTLRIVPDSIWIIGPEKLLPDIDAIYTENLILTDVKRNIHKKINLDINNIKHRENIIFMDSVVDIIADIKPFTELEIEVSVNIKQEGIEGIFSIFPNRAKVRYRVSYEDYKKLSPFDFEVSAIIPRDYKKHQLAILKVLNKPDFVKINRIEPEYVNYMLNDE